MSSENESKLFFSPLTTFSIMVACLPDGYPAVVGFDVGFAGAVVTDQPPVFSGPHGPVQGIQDEVVVPVHGGIFDLNQKSAHGFAPICFQVPFSSSTITWSS